VEKRSPPDAGASPEWLTASFSACLTNAALLHKRMIDYEPLRKSIEQLQASLRYQQSDLALNDKDIGKQFRAAAIQAFECCFEIGIKMLRRRLEEILRGAEVERFSYRDLLGTGVEKGFIDDPHAWFRYREMRNITSQSYDEAKAEMIASVLPEFAGRALCLLQELQRNAL
jgi:nucleotidyltransferase substrate binding protein (TIGR01987 family)